MFKFIGLTALFLITAVAILTALAIDALIGYAIGTSIYQLDSSKMVDVSFSFYALICNLVAYALLSLFNMFRSKEFANLVSKYQSGEIVPVQVRSRLLDTYDRHDPSSVYYQPYRSYR